MSDAARYPLSALGELRRRLVDEARAELGRAVADAEHVRRGAEEARRGAEAASTRRQSAERLPVGTTAAAGDGRARWLARLRGDERALGAEAGSRREEVARADAQVERRRRGLAEAERQLRAVELHRERWEAERRRTVSLAEEGEQEDRAAGAAQPPT